MDFLVKLQNKVPQKQRQFQNDPRPIYWRSPRAKLYNNLWFTGLAVGLGGVAWGAVQMIKGLSPGLQRARAPFRTRNAITGLTIGAFVVGVWAYSISAVKQDTFEDLDEEAKELLAARMKDERIRNSTGSGTTATGMGTVAQGSGSSLAAPSSPSSTSSSTSVTASVKGDVEKLTSPSSPSTTVPAGDKSPRGVLAAHLHRHFPQVLDPASRSLVWGAPPVDRIGRLGDKNDRPS
ncbi:uncharacterized protein FOMMEDRAFT_169486 [Fomitiporia mediterranea MF3/22]|uniref:uncharacterized protein n=1 Tax=Fomitiporia mediterranea (strain MF3/22) TaxID=694068 RepID=UPI0004408178|nr:uncharacterized protein FOMMEDRAFT_169486 [Fomitiporia mediterranea MF3/22]EJD01347.1 hypothetical protein FOMMEDRAFT_169486 [Fomitiporia mediterranea MF3/22]